MDARISRLAAAIALLLLMGAAPALGESTGTSTTPDFDQTQRTEPAPRPARVLPRELRGRAAIDALGGAAPDGRGPQRLSSSARLKKILTEDKSVWLAEDGQMLYRDEMPASDVEAPPDVEAPGDTGPPTLPGEPPAIDVSPGSTEGSVGSGYGSSTTPAYPTSQTFTLHSRPNATKQIFLDFDGAEVAGTGWNDGSVPMPAILYTGYDSDGNVNAFSTAEHAWIQEVWRQVSEAYAPFDVDVTTVDEGESARTRSTSSDTTYGTQVVFSNSLTAVAAACNSTCLGVAYVGTFDNIDPIGYYQPAWVFTKTTMSTIIAAQGASHEAGHTLGLHHDGTSTASYYAGTSAWGPIMGSARHRAISQFSLGEYAGANNFEDDFAVVKANGLSTRVDDHGSSVGTAAALGAQSSYAVNGVLSTRLDQDVFAVDVQCPTDLTATVNGIGPQTTADLKLDVLDATGAVIASSAPASGYSGSPPVSNGMNASVTVPGAIGTYFLRVDGVGYGDPRGTGWSDFGSLGQYGLTANGCTGPASEPGEDPPATRPSAPRIGTASSPRPRPGRRRRGSARPPPAPRVAPRRPPPAGRRRRATGVPRSPSTACSPSASTPSGRVIATYSSAYQGPSVRKVTMTLPKSRYRFVVVAWNRVGASPYSKLSNIVYAR